MKTVADYAVKWKFGVTSPYPWSPSHPHMGVDRPTPMRTPLVINGLLVGYTGNTGGVAPHHHLQKVQNGQVVDPQNDGFTIPEPAIVFQVDNVDDTNIGKALRIKDGQGIEWSHFHLDEITVAQGQEIKGGDMQKDIDQLYKLVDQCNKDNEAQRVEIEKLYGALDSSNKRIDQLEKGSSATGEFQTITVLTKKV